MSRGHAFVLILLGGLLIVAIGIGLILSAFVGGKYTKAGRVRAIVGGVIIAAGAVAYFVFLN